MRQRNWQLIVTFLFSIILTLNIRLGYPIVTFDESIWVNQLYFDKTIAYKLIEEQVNIGPRYPGSKGIEECRKVITSHLLPENKWTINFQNFSKMWFDNKNVTLVNIICQPSQVNSELPLFLMLAHYDTRLFADQDPNPQKQKEPVLGANDGASGVAVILELGRVLVQHHNITNFQLIFFDGEDQGGIEGWNWLIGSRFYVTSDKFKNNNISFGILFDIVGGKNAIFRRERNSDNAAGEIVSQVWNEAQNLGYDNFFQNESGLTVIDDHIPLLEEGVPTIDIIDNFPNIGTWHTSSDNLTFISERTLHAVGQTIESFLTKYAVSKEWLAKIPEVTFHSPLSGFIFVLGLGLCHSWRIFVKKRKNKFLKK